VLDSVFVVLVGAAAFDEPLELHAPSTTNAKRHQMTCARVRREANTFMPFDATERARNECECRRPVR